MEVFDAAELWSRDQIEHTQLTRLKATVAHVRKSEFYRRRLDEAGVTPESITSLDDIRRIPFTTKQDLRDQYPTGLLCVPRSEIVRMHCSSGTTGSPVAICHTQNDINSWADLMARCLYMVGVRRDDVFQNMSGYGLFTGGLGIHFGAERLGCMTIPAGPGNSRRQIKLAKDFKTTVAHILPSYALILGEHLRNMGEDPRDFPLRIAVVGAEPYTVEFRRRIEELFDMKAYNSYGLSEMNGPGVAFECQNQNGLHVWEDAYLPEIVDPKTGEPVPDGEIGELVMTCLCRQGMPILRYRTRDLTRFLPGECSCGRHHRRIDRILGRADDMFIIKGVYHALSFSPVSYQLRILKYLKLMAYRRLSHSKNLRKISDAKFTFHKCVQDSYSRRISEHFKKFCKIVQHFLRRLVIRHTSGNIFNLCLFLIHFCLHISSFPELTLILLSYQHMFICSYVHYTSLLFAVNTFI